MRLGSARKRKVREACVALGREEKGKGKKVTLGEARKRGVERRVARGSESRKN